MSLPEALWMALPEALMLMVQACDIYLAANSQISRTHDPGKRRRRELG